MKHHFILTLAAFALVLAACGGGQTLAAEATATSVPTNASEPTATVDGAATEAAEATAAVFNAISDELTDAGYDTSSGSVAWVQGDAVQIIVAGRNTSGVFDDLGITSSFGDFALSVDITWETGPNSDSGCGMVFRAGSLISGEASANKDPYVDFYTLNGSGLGVWGIEYYQSGIFQRILSNGESLSIKDVQGDTNRYLLVAQGNDARLFVNGNMLVSAEFADDAASTAPTVSLPAAVTEGQIGYLAWGGSGMTTCTFTNGIVWNLGD